MSGDSLIPTSEPLLTVYHNCQDLAWTGYKNSGKGQTLGRFGFEQFVKSKSFHIKDYPK